MRAVVADAHKWLDVLPARSAATALAQHVARTHSSSSSSSSDSDGENDDPVRRCLERDAAAIAALAETVRADLEQALAAARGETKQTNAVRALLGALAHGTLPARWRRYVVPDALAVSAFVRDLARRFAQLERLVGSESTSDSGASASSASSASSANSAGVWLGGLLSPEAFTTATRQAAARALHCSLETLRLETVALRPDEGDGSVPAADLRRGVFAVSGMRLENGKLRATGVLDSAPEAAGAQHAAPVRTAVFAWRPCSSESESSESSDAAAAVDVPVFLNETRRVLLFNARVPVATEDESKESSVGEDGAAAVWCRRAVAFTCWQQSF